MDADIVFADGAQPVRDLVDAASNGQEGLS